MKPIVIVRRAAALLCLLFLLLDLYAWAGLSRDPEVGVAVSRSIEREGALAWVYASAGRPLVATLGVEQGAIRFAGRHFDAAREAVAANPEAAMDLIGQHMGLLMRVMHYGAPLLGLLWLLLWWRRPRELKMFRR